MRKLQGKSVCKGIVMGPVAVLESGDSQVKRIRLEETEVEAEIQAVERAVRKAQEQLQELYEKALKEVGESSAAIFEVHQMMLEDEETSRQIICIWEKRTTRHWDIVPSASA